MDFGYGLLIHTSGVSKRMVRMRSRLAITMLPGANRQRIFKLLGRMGLLLNLRWADSSEQALASSISFTIVNQERSSPFGQEF